MALDLLIDGVLFVLLGAIAGMLVLFHVRLKTFRREMRAMPALADDLAQALVASQKALQQFSQAAQGGMPKMDDATARAGRTLQELTYVLDRAEKMLSRFDTHLAQPQQVTQYTPQPAAPALQPTAAETLQTLQAQMEVAAPVTTHTTPATPTPQRPATAVVMPQPTPAAAIAARAAQTQAAAPQTTTTTTAPRDLAEATRAIGTPLEGFGQRQNVQPARPDTWARRVDDDEAEKRAVVRVASPSSSAAAYAMAQQAQNNKPRSLVSDAEMALRRALEGSL